MKNFTYMGKSYQLIKNASYNLLVLMKLAKEVNECEEIIDFINAKPSGFDNDIYIMAITHINKCEAIMQNILTKCAN